MNKFLDYYFWFAQPSTILTNEDKYLGIFFAILLGIAIIFRVLVFLNSNPINKALFRKLWHFAFSISLSGLVWFGVRYENTPLFSQRYWAGLTLAVGLIWLIFILKYLIWNFPKQKSSFDREQIKNKYIPKAK
ncbi:MAG: hypothetical protein KW802_03055 [Candidatus Doudnabacteria bacterium]|nr:hypothetical protein [Candidatus Doudnabacteria bacterium]